MPSLTPPLGADVAPQDLESERGDRAGLVDLASSPTSPLPTDDRCQLCGDLRERFSLYCALHDRSHGIDSERARAQRALAPVTDEDPPAPQDERCRVCGGPRTRLSLYCPLHDTTHGFHSERAQRERNELEGLAAAAARRARRLTARGRICRAGR